jgi:hypothetical protein
MTPQVLIPLEEYNRLKLLEQLADKANYIAIAIEPPRQGKNTWTVLIENERLSMRVGEVDKSTAEQILGYNIVLVKK